MIEVSKTHIHWNYYIALENDLGRVARYIEFIEANFKTYSIELAHILLASSSEIDVVMKELCVLLSPSKKPENINEYRKIIKEKLSSFIDEKAYSHRYGLTLSPWSNWQGEQNPDWWKSYNNVKHQRNIYFNEANLKNVLNSIAALMIVNLYYYREKLNKEFDYPYEFKEVTNKLNSKSKLFKLQSNYYYDTLIV